jgi:hypothetical protein
MRERIERVSYRFQLCQKERYGDQWPADPTTPRNPLRFVALVAVMSLILDSTEPFVVHRASSEKVLRMRPNQNAAANH